MPNLSDRLPLNVAGRYYVDSTCIDCDLCRSTAPEFFKRDDEGGTSIVYRQPFTALDVDLAEEALSACPTASIGNDADPTPADRVMGAPGEPNLLRLD